MKGTIKKIDSKLVFVGSVSTKTNWIAAWIKTEKPMTKDCPTSNPLIPARMLIEFVQNTASKDI